MPQISRRHHTVPRFYLDGFAKDRRIGTVRLPGDTRFVQSTRYASAQTDFYTIPEAVDGPDVFERTLAQIEGAAARVFNRLKDDDGWPLDPECRGTLATYLAVQFLRGPDRRRQIEQMLRLATQLQIGIGGRESVEAWAMRERGVSLTCEEADRIWDEATQPGGPPISLSAAGHVEQLADSLPTVYPYFAGRPWVLIRFGRRSLMTCDTPIALIPDEDTSPFSGVGVGSALAMTFPLSRKMGLVLSSPEPWFERVHIDEVSAGALDGQAEPSTRYAAMFNYATVQNSREWIFHHPDDADLVPADLHEPVRDEVAATVPDFRTDQSPPAGDEPADANESQN